MPTEFKKQCPQCNSIQYYTLRENLSNAIKKNKLCRKCKRILIHKATSDMYINQTFNSWTVLSKQPFKIRGETVFSCRCKCGKIQDCRQSGLKCGRNRQCIKCGIISAANKNRTTKPYEWIYRRLVSRALSSNLVNTISYEDYLEYTKVKTCHYCDIPLIWPPYNIKGQSSAYQLDRKDNSVGYTKENCVVCCKNCNSIKHTFIPYTTMLKIGKLLKEERNLNLIQAI